MGECQGALSPSESVWGSPEFAQDLSQRAFRAPNPRYISLVCLRLMKITRLLPRERLLLHDSAGEGGALCRSTDLA